MNRRLPNNLIWGGLLATIIGIVMHYRRNRYDVKMNRVMNFIFNVMGYLGIFQFIGGSKWLNKYVTIRLR